VPGGIWIRQLGSETSVHPSEEEEEEEAGFLVVVQVHRRREGRCGRGRMR
jgi:hypothetical protein